MVLSSEKEERARAIERDIEAELAISAGSESILSTYFREVETPNPEVLQSLVWCLVGADLPLPISSS
jgi:hypothetical protein